MNAKGPSVIDVLSKASGISKEEVLKIRERVRDNHRAIGVPITNRIAVVSDASFRVSQIAAKSALVSVI